MNYRVRRQGQDLGTFSIEELRARRQAGVFSGAEYVQGQGMTDWQPIDFVLQHGYRTLPPPLSSTPRASSNLTLLWVGVGLAILLFVGGMGVFVFYAIRAAREMKDRLQAYGNDSRGVEVARQPIVWTTNTPTEVTLQIKRREFRTRQYLEGYQKYGLRNPASDDDALLLLQLWIAENWGGPTPTNATSFQALSDKLAAPGGCDDPIVLTVAALEELDRAEKIDRLERALKNFESSKHKSYPKFFATITLANQFRNEPARAAKLDAAAVELLKQAFADGSFLETDQEEVADILVDGWAQSFFNRNYIALYGFSAQLGPSYEWLSHLLQGEYYVTAAWKARGGGYTRTVTAQSWKDFKENLASARKSFTKAWELRPDLPIPAARMISVAMGESDIEGMRLWFDRATAAQVDCPRAWSAMQWGLRRRWLGSHDAMLALGEAGIDTGRFDTDVPRKYFSIVTSIENELEYGPGEHIYDRADIWPQLQRLYEGYIAEADRTDSGRANGWRTTYSVVAYIAQEYKVSREQLESLDWKLNSRELSGWGLNLSLMTEEVAALTGPMAEELVTANDEYSEESISGALQLFRDLAGRTNADLRTREFIRHRVAALEKEERLVSGDWVDLLPSEADDPNWIVWGGRYARPADGSLEAHAASDNQLLFSRLRTGSRYELKGEFEIVRAGDRHLELGIAAGLPQRGDYHWVSFETPDATTANSASASANPAGPNQTSPATTSFLFRLEDGVFTLTLDGKAIRTRASLAENPQLNENQMLTGIGAFHCGEGSIIRYRQLQLRKLKPPAPATGR